jgi:dTDP-4-dehydrorhamnose 3,5-epimerase
MTITPIQELAGVHEITFLQRGDARGYFMRAYCEKEFRDHGLNTTWVQDNQSMSATAGTVRGLHFQYSPSSETKLVRCITGSILDVIVDIREGSATFGQHHATLLSAENQKALYVPRGFAHGFCVIESPAIVHYKVDNFYSPTAEGGLLWNDPALGISWPTTYPPIISQRDTEWPTLAELKPVTL